MAEQKIIVLKDNKHTPAEAGDTIAPSLVPVSGEQGNALSVKDDGLFVTGTSLAATQDAPNTSTGDDVPTEFFGSGRDKLLAEPDKWLEVTIGGERGVVPWFKLP